VKRKVVFLGYYMFLLSQTIKEEYLRTHIVILTENTDTGTSDTGEIPLPKIWLVTPWNATLLSISRGRGNKVRCRYVPTLRGFPS
jgi:hypothetical protein